jgi:hypothetical protein
MIVNEIASAAQSAALSVADQQMARAAQQVGVVAEALHAAARTFEQSQSPIAAEYANSAARQVEGFVKTIGGRHWTEIAADLEEMARHRPARFVSGAVLLGFIAGRLLTATPRRSEPSDRRALKATEGSVKAAVASGTGNDEMADWPPATQAPELQ